MIRMALNYCEVQYEDEFLDFATFAAKKAAGEFQYGQVPVLDLDDGTRLCQSNAILRYVCSKYTGKKGEKLYPGAQDPILSHAIDSACEFCEDFVAERRFFYLKKIGTEEYDQDFTQFILKKFPEWLEKLEGKLDHTHKYLLSDNLTMADISVASSFFQHVYNNDYDYCHILEAIVLKYPKVTAYLKKLQVDLKDTYALKK